MHYINRLTAEPAISTWILSAGLDCDLTSFVISKLHSRAGRKARALPPSVAELASMQRNLRCAAKALPFGLKRQGPTGGFAEQSTA
jgi:hypothetical protein